VTSQSTIVLHGCGIRLCARSRSFKGARTLCAWRRSFVIDPDHV
jgi:hypothetical protein